MPNSIVYCTQPDLERYLSAQGVTAFADHDQNGEADEGVVEDCIQQASEEINLFVGQWYSPANLAQSALIARWSTILSGYFLCERRGNPVPESLQAEFSRIMETLERIRAGQMRLPGIAFRADMRPVVANLTPDRGASDGPIRVDTVTSPHVPSVLPRKTLNNGGPRYGF